MSDNEAEVMTWDELPQRYAALEAEVVSLRKERATTQLALEEVTETKDALLEENDRLRARAELADEVAKHLTRVGVNWRGTDTFEASWLAGYDALTSSLPAGEPQLLTMTDLMITPEAIDEFLLANPPPTGEVQEGGSDAK